MQKISQKKLHSAVKQICRNWFAIAKPATLMAHHYYEVKIYTICDFLSNLGEMQCTNITNRPISKVTDREIDF